MPGHDQDTRGRPCRIAPENRPRDDDQRTDTGIEPSGNGDATPLRLHGQSDLGTDIRYQLPVRTGQAGAYCLSDKPSVRTDDLDGVQLQSVESHRIQLFARKLRIPAQGIVIESVPLAPVQHIRAHAVRIGLNGLLQDVTIAQHQLRFGFTELAQDDFLAQPGHAECGN